MNNGDNSFRGYFVDTLDEFEFENGCVLNDVKVEYSLSGTPKYDDEGNITNLIIPCHNFRGNYSFINDLHELTKSGGPFDKNEYCFISITSLGNPESCSPSISGLNHKFPGYTIKDMVNFKRQFIKEKFNIGRVHGVIGRGFGGYEVYTWACEYPDEMDFIVIGNSSYKTNGYRYVVSKAVDSIIESSDDFYGELYTESLSRILVSISKLIYSNYFSKKIFQKMSNDEIDVLMDDFVDEGLFVDIYDIKYRNDSILGYDVEDKLKNIKAKAIIFTSTDDIYYDPEFDALPLKNLIKDSTVVLLDLSENLREYEDFSIFIDYLNKFLEPFKK